MRSALAAAALLWAGLAHAVVDFGGEAGLGFDSNAGNARDDADVRESVFATASATAQWASPLGAAFAVLGRATAAAEQHDGVQGLSNQKATGLVRVLHKTGRGFHAPALSAWMSAAAWNFNSDLRDGQEYRGGVFAMQQWTTALSGRLSVGASERVARSRVFDIRTWSAALDLDWTVGSRVAAYAGYRFQDGDVVSTSAADPVIRDLARARAPDDAFAAGQVAYRLDGESRVGTLGLNYSISRRLSVDLQAQHIDATASGGNDYERWISVCSVLARLGG